ncbi:hypothetical protein [Pseudoalteromonas piscicida]|uniref:Uncharacterized protein n=1 Tax=Pseudoalteromonas piscicida TaxID=43662 RepID=A0A2A5JJA7_PSEO7|nr:hypothetical protein [Pseudoalteromonas piscicida]PCK29543.1 hypothetical protein CEX98_22350 [Pseudoalteromonas piscicida]
MNEDKKMDWLPRLGAFMIAVSSAIACVAAVAGIIIDGFEMISLAGIAVSLLFFYVSVTILFKGKPPSFLEWTR